MAKEEGRRWRRKEEAWAVEEVGEKVTGSVEAAAEGGGEEEGIKERKRWEFNRREE